MKEMTSQEARLLSPLNLAYIGDGIYELLTRRHIIAQGNAPVNLLHRKTVAIVCAAAQSRAFGVIEGILSEEELTIYKRGRNANGNHVPKNSDPQDYRRATGVEALFGYLYLTGRMDRVTELYEMIYRSTQDAPPCAAGKEEECAAPQLPEESDQAAFGERDGQ